MKKPTRPGIDRRIRDVVIATGIGSVITQLLTIREFLCLLNGNELVIALILFNWLFIGALGTLLARPFGRRPSVRKLWAASLALIILAPVQLMSIRRMYELVFVSGSSVGFYPTLIYTFITTAPYALLIGFVLPYSLVVIRTRIPQYSGTRIYIFDNLGDVCGGALFSFVLIYFATPFQAVAAGHLPLVAALFCLYRTAYPDTAWPVPVAGTLLALMTLAGAMILEMPSLAPRTGHLAFYQETPFGRLRVVQDREQTTIFQNGQPVFYSQSQGAAETAVHYPLAQIPDPDQILLISADRQMMQEALKHEVDGIDYVEIDPALTRVEHRFGLLFDHPAITEIHQDGRHYLRHTQKSYDAIILNLPEPDNFQINRFFTKEFFALAKSRLTNDGVLSFSVKGYESYISDTELEKVSVLYGTAHRVFDHVLMIPGNRLFFMCADTPLNPDIPALLAKKSISTNYISGYYYGDIPFEKINDLKNLVQELLPCGTENTDFSPHLVRILLDEWFSVFAASPAILLILLAAINILYVCYISKEEFVLYTTGGFTMGAEILVIFAFQIFFGYIYLQIGLIVTVFLAGLLPGALIVQHVKKLAKPVLIAGEIFLTGLMILFFIGITRFPEHLTSTSFLVFGFFVSLVCGAQFPAALYLSGSGKPAVIRLFSADLMGAALGTLVTSVFLIPYVGILWTVAVLVAMKLTSLMVLGWIR